MLVAAQDISDPHRSPPPPLALRLRAHHSLLPLQASNIQHSRCIHEGRKLNFKQVGTCELCAPYTFLLTPHYLRSGVFVFSLLLTENINVGILTKAYPGTFQNNSTKYIKLFDNIIKNDLYTVNFVCFQQLQVLSRP